MTQTIPGVNFHYKDEGRFIPVIEGAQTESVLIIGCAVDGPVNIPVRVAGKSLEKVFGPVTYDADYVSDRYDAVTGVDPNYGRPNGNTLVKAYSEVMQGGCNDIILMRIADVDGTVCKAATAAIADTPVADSGPYVKADVQTGDTVLALLGINISGRFPGTIYNGIGLKLTYTIAASDPTAAQLDIHQEIKKKGRAVSIPICTGAGTVISKRQLIEKINGEYRNQGIIASSVEGDDLEAEVPLARESKTGAQTSYFVLDGGTDGTRGSGTGKFAAAKDVFEAMMGGSAAVAAGEPDESSALAQLETLEADIVYMAAVYADENVGTAQAPMTIAIPFAKALHTASKNEYPMQGVVGTKPATDSYPTRVSTIVENLAVTQYTGTPADAIVTASGMLKLGYFLSMDPDSKTTTFSWVDPDLNETVDLGQYILCVAGPDFQLNSNKLGKYVETGAGLFAGLISTLPPDRAATHMIMPGAQGLTYQFTGKQLNKVAGGAPYDETLLENGLGGSYVVFRKSTSSSAILVNLDNTCASRLSDYASYQIKYIVNMVAAGLKKVTEPFIGKSAHATTKAALENQVRVYLDYIASTRAIAGGYGSGYNFTITASGFDQLLGRINIELELHPALQIKTVNVVISVAPPSGS